jgi:hypothetical protein
MSVSVFLVFAKVSTRDCLFNGHPYVSYYSGINYNKFDEGY